MAKKLRGRNLGVKFPDEKREGIKGLILRRCGNLNSTHPSKLRQSQQALLIVHCGCRNAPDEPSILCIAACALRHLQKNSCYHNARAAMHEMNIPFRGLQLVHTICGCRSLQGWVDFSLPQRCNISLFIRSPIIGAK